eukprot:TRINITY_DN108924_c0_g1_i1.p1 TRINITY_DN108924_c0_g1~~TRINITY_DN108924_c0_g1_i1.p1  ORF type:complete len:454 (+),score=16.57 TRINITY_DN108924_c0_g1_i1:103-1362(+)
MYIVCSECKQKVHRKLTKRHKEHYCPAIRRKAEEILEKTALFSLASYRATHYSELRYISTLEATRVNFYSVVLSCSGVYYHLSTGKCMAVFDLIDHTLSPNTCKVTPKTLSLSIFSHTVPRLSLAEVPRPLKVGSILRVHRGEMKSYQGGFQANCDVGIKGAWGLFDAVEGNVPINHSHGGYSFIEGVDKDSDSKLLASIREFSKNYFETTELDYMNLREAEAMKLKDFDTLCFVLYVKSAGTRIKLLLCDETRIVKLYITLDCKNHMLCEGARISPLSIIYIRAANYIQSVVKPYEEIHLTDVSKVLEVPKTYKSAVALMQKLESANIPKVIKDRFCLYSNDSSNRVVNKVLPEYDKLIPMTLESILRTKEEGRFYRTQFRVIEIGPHKPSNWIIPYDSALDLKSSTNTKYYSSFKCL